VTTLIIGARTEEQLRQNLGALEAKLSGEQLARRARRGLPYPRWHQRQYERNGHPPG
jgi:aryl-alcohol dehydrogenase-like predicted oxidoreductase